MSCYRLPELNLFSLSFLPLPDGEYTLAIIHFDYQQRIQLLARDIELEDLQLSSFPSTQLHSTMISDKLFPYPTDNPPMLVPVYATQRKNEEDLEDETMENSQGQFLGGVLVVGGKKLLLYELVDKEGQEKQKGKRRRLEDKKKSKDPLELAKAREKEAEREGRRRRPGATVVWPWSEVSASVFDLSTLGIWVLKTRYQMVFCQQFFKVYPRRHVRKDSSLITGQSTRFGPRTYSSGRGE